MLVSLWGTILTASVYHLDGVQGKTGHRQLIYLVYIIESMMLAYLCFNFLTNSNREEEIFERNMNGLLRAIFVGILAVSIHGLRGWLWIGSAAGGFFVLLYMFSPASIAEPVTQERPVVYIIKGTRMVRYSFSLDPLLLLLQQGPYLKRWCRSIPRQILDSEHACTNLQTKKVWTTLLWNLHNEFR